MNAPHHDLRIKIATEPSEFTQIHRLNYGTFVEEIPQHEPNSEGRLVDRFHAENTYLIVLRGACVVGMLALRSRRPYSLDGKLPDLDSYLPKGRNPIEVRLLSVAPEFRNSAVFVSLFHHAVRKCVADGFDIALISATTRQLKLYRHLGFTAFGPLVGTPGAQFQPMYLTSEAFQQAMRRSSALRAASGRAEAAPASVNLLPGPVMMSPEVCAATT